MNFAMFGTRYQATCRGLPQISLILRDFWCRKVAQLKKNTSIWSSDFLELNVIESQNLVHSNIFVLVVTCPDRSGVHIQCTCCVG